MRMAGESCIEVVPMQGFLEQSPDFNPDHLMIVVQMKQNIGSMDHFIQHKSGQPFIVLYEPFHFFPVHYSIL
jgi:hypothetical protein